MIDLSDYESYIRSSQCGRIISDDGSRVIGYWGTSTPEPKIETRTDVLTEQIIQGSQNRITQTKTNTPDMSNQVNSLIAGTITGAAGIAGMFAIKPSVKNIVNSATQKKVTNSKDKQPPESKVDFKFSSGVKNSSEVKIVDISAIIKQSTQSNNTKIEADEANYIKPDNSNTSILNKKNSGAEVTISSAPKDAIHKIEVQENNKTVTFKEMSETELDGMDKTATQIEGTSSLVFGGPLYVAFKKSKYGKYSSMVLSGYKLFNKGVLMTGQIPLEKELNMNGDMGRAAGHEIATFGTGLLVPLIPVVGPAISFIDAAGSAITGISVIEEGTRFVEDGARVTFEAGFDSGYNKKWDSTAPKVETLENHITKLETSIKNSEPNQRRDKQVKLLQKVQKYKNEIETRRKKIEEEKPTLNDARDWSLLNPDFMP